VQRHLARPESSSRHYIQFIWVGVASCDVASLHQFALDVGFTQLSASVPTSEIILILNELFSEFDRAVDLANVYKVGWSKS